MAKMAVHINVGYDTHLILENKDALLLADIWSRGQLVKHHWQPVNHYAKTEKESLTMSTVEDHLILDERMPVDDNQS